MNKLALISVFLLMSAFGASTNAETPVKKEAPLKKLKMNFENELVTGSASTPSVDQIFSRKHFNYKKLIRLRENFIPEAEQGKAEFHGSH